jgi:hypothetical protein
VFALAESANAGGIVARATERARTERAKRTMGIPLFSNFVEPNLAGPSSRTHETLHSIDKRAARREAVPDEFGIDV